MTCLFHKQGVPTSGRKIPPDGKTGFCAHNRCAETQTIFPSSYNRSSDGPTFEESNEQPGGGKKNGLVGN